LLAVALMYQAEYWCCQIAWTWCSTGKQCCCSVILSRMWHCRGWQSLHTRNSHRRPW